MFIRLFACLTTMAMVGCGGGGGDPLETGIAPASSTQDYSPSAGVRHSYTPFASPSHGYLLPISDDRTEVSFGGDLEPRQNIRHVSTNDGIRYYFGPSRDGVGVNYLENFEKDLLSESSDADFAPFSVQPYLYFDSDLLKDKNSDILKAVFDSVMILNDALPPEFQVDIRWEYPGGALQSGEILIDLDSPHVVRSECSASAIACARTWKTTGETWSSILFIPDDLDTSEFMFPRTVIVHELLHALGIWGHVDSIEFPDSIMGTSGNYLPNLGFILSRTDREVLQIMYMSQRTDLYNDWGEWTDTAFHLMGRSEDGDMNFGVALFNGLPQPWARGVFPESNIVDNDELSGTATWSGGLVAFSGSSPLGGDVDLTVNIPGLHDPDYDHDLNFSDIYFVNRAENQDMSASSDRWFYTRNIDYKVWISENEFGNDWSEGYEEGWVRGAFMGPEHEHMGGTVKRTDLVGAFGGSR